MYPQQSHGTWRGNRCGLLDLEDVGCLETSHGEDLLTQGHECLNGLEESMAERELHELDELGQFEDEHG